MKYPVINGKALSADGRGFFRVWHMKVHETIMRDNSENRLNLSKKDADLLAWNIAATFTASYVTRKR